MGRKALVLYCNDAVRDHAVLSPPSLINFKYMVKAADND